MQIIKSKISIYRFFSGILPDFVQEVGLFYIIYAILKYLIV